MIFETRFESFLKACQDINRRREKLAMPAIVRQMQDRVDPAVPNDALLSHIISEALMRRVDRSLVDAKNIYLQKFEVSQLDLFYAMCRAYPQVPMGHSIANQYLAHAARSLARACFLDIGIGKGVQAANLVRALTEDPGKLQHLDVLGLDPAPENLDMARSNVEEAAKTARSRNTGSASGPFSVAYHSLNKLLEECKPDDFGRIATLAGDGLLVNSAYSFHHTMHAVGDVDLRTTLLRRVAALRPRVFTLVEPNADHDNEYLPRRLSACWEHFGTVFDLIDEADIDDVHKFVVKEKFFGREMRDIFGTSDAFRCERHERCESWLLRLTKAGFRPYPRIDIHAPLPQSSSRSFGDGLVRLGYRGLPLIAVFAYEACSTPLPIPPARDGLPPDAPNPAQEPDR